MTLYHDVATIDRNHPVDHGDHRHRDHDETRETPLRRVLSLVFTIAVVAFTIYMWPAMLGGNARLVVVSGHSMEPTYDLFDIVVTRDGGDTEVGDIVVFSVPEGEAKGMLIIHRVHEVDDDGHFITQGDNRDTPDQWQLTEDDIVGKPLLRVPQGGKVVGFIQDIRIIALLVGLVVLFMLWPDDEEPDETNAFERDATWALFDLPDRRDPSVDELAQAWLVAELERPIDDAVMADAMAWLDEQLERCQQPISQ